MDIRIGSGLSKTGNWNCGVNVSAITGGTVTSIEVFELGISEDAPFEDAAICVYDGADTIYFYGTNIGQVPGVQSQAVHIGRKVNGAFPQWIKFVGGNFEASSSSNNIVIDAGRDVQFYVRENQHNNLWRLANTRDRVQQDCTQHQAVHSSEVVTFDDVPRTFF